MPDQIVRTKSPEERELDSKLAELAVLEEQLAQRELQLSTLQAELKAFELRYLRVVGSRLAKMDDITARIAEVLALLNPSDDTVRQYADQARKEARRSAHAAGSASAEPEKLLRFKPSERLKTLFRELAKLVHPDLTTDEGERARRTPLMAEVNAAYQAGDEARLEAIRRDWAHRPESVEGEDVAARLVRAIRKVSQLTDRLAAIDAEISRMEGSDTCKLRTQSEVTEDEGGDLLNEMAAELDEDIAARQRQLEDLEAELAGRKERDRG